MKRLFLILTLTLVPNICWAESFSEHSSQGPGHNTANHGEKASGNSMPVASPGPRMTDAELEENDRKANDPNFTPDPNDPDGCLGGGCEPPTQPAEEE